MASNTGPFPPPLPPALFNVPVLDPDEEPGVTGAVEAIGQAINRVARYDRVMSQIQVPRPAPPQGPKLVTVTNVGTGVRLDWRDDPGPSPVLFFTIWRAAANTRSAPTTPTFGPATTIKVDTVPAGGVCAPGQPTGYTYVDNKFQIIDKDPANPSRFVWWVQSNDIYGRASQPISSGPGGLPQYIEVQPAGNGDLLTEKGSPLNLLWNAGLNSSATAAGVAVRSAITDIVAVTDATNASPIVIKSVAHPFTTGNRVGIYFVRGNTAANGIWSVTKVDADHFSLNGSTGNGAFTAGAPFPAAAYLGIGTGGGPADGQPEIPPVLLADGTPCYIPWFSLNSSAGSPIFRGDGGLNSLQMGEVLFPTMSNVINDGSSIETGCAAANRRGSRMSLSAFIKTYSFSASAASYALTMTIFYTAAGASLSIVSPPMNASLFTSTFTRFVFNFTAPTCDPGTYMLARFTFSFVGGLDDPTFQIVLRQPMLAWSDSGGDWTSQLQPYPNFAISTLSDADVSVASWQRSGGRLPVVVRDPSAPYTY